MNQKKKNKVWILGPGCGGERRSLNGYPDLHIVSTQVAVDKRALHSPSSSSQFQISYRDRVKVTVRKIRIKIRKSRSWKISFSTTLLSDSSIKYALKYIPILSSLQLSAIRERGSFCCYSRTLIRVFFLCRDCSSKSWKWCQLRRISLRKLGWGW